MSEDVDIKLIPTESFKILSRGKKKILRKALIQQVETNIIQSENFQLKINQVVMNIVILSMN